MYGYLIYGSCDGFGNDVFVAGDTVFTSFEEACAEADEWNKNHFYDYSWYENTDFHAYYNEMKNEFCCDVPEVRYFTPVKIKIK